MDFIGPKFSFELEDSNHFQSVQGGLLTTLVGMVAFVIWFLFSKEIYERKTPNVSNAIETVPDSVVYFNEFPLIFFLSSPTTGKKIKNYRDYFDTSIFGITMNPAWVVTADSSTYDFAFCDSSKFKKYKNLVEDVLTKDTKDTFLCMNFDNKAQFSNAFFALNSTNMNLWLRKCDKNQRKCADDLDVVLKDILVWMYYIDSSVDTSNFLNPVSTSLSLITV